MVRVGEPLSPSLLFYRRGNEAQRGELAGPSSLSIGGRAGIETLVSAPIAAKQGTELPFCYDLSHWARALVRQAHVCPSWSEWPWTTDIPRPGSMH